MSIEGESSRASLCYVLRQQGQEAFGHLDGDGDILEATASAGEWLIPRSQRTKSMAISVICDMIAASWPAPLARVISG